MTEAQLLAQYGYWGEHPKLSVSAWQGLVADGYTRMGYWAWVANQLDFAEEA